MVRANWPDRAAENEMARHLAESGIVSPSFVVSAYCAIGDEIDALAVAALLPNRLVLPVMQGKGKPLLFRSWAPGEPLQTRIWNICEPLPDAPAIDPDIVMVPLLAFDARGIRLGYGGGFFDRTLARLRAARPIVAVGLAFDEQEVDTVPHEPYDQPLDCVLTPSGLRDFRKD